MTHKLTTEEMHRMTVEEFRQSEKLPLTVVLDNVRSLNNIGSVFRTSDAFRVEHIALCGITCVRGLKEKGYRVYAVELAHDSLKLGTDEVATDKLVAIVFGNEIDGVQEEVMELCDGYLEIPQAGTKHSLNVSCAAAIVIWELFKQLRVKN